MEMRKQVDVRFCRNAKHILCSVCCTHSLRCVAENLMAMQWNDELNAQAVDKKNTNQAIFGRKLIPLILPQVHETSLNSFPTDS